MNECAKEILMEAYNRLADEYLNSNKKRKSVPIKTDQALAMGILSKLCVALIYLSIVSGTPKILLII